LTKEWNEILNESNY